MRRPAVLTTLFACGLGLGSCTGNLLLPGGLGDAGASSGGRSGGGGRSGSPTGGAGGIFTPGGRSGQGSGGNNRGSCTTQGLDLRFNISKAMVLLSVGRDISMNTRFGEGTRLSVVQQAVRNLVSENQNAVAFGYHDFPSTAPCFGGAACCANDDWVNIVQNAYSAIDRALEECDTVQPTGVCMSRPDRPIADAVRTAQIILGSDSNVERYLVLITDGAPSCFAEDSAKSCKDAQLEVSKLSLMGIKTYVVTVGDDVEQVAEHDCLQKIATMGGVGSQNSPLSGGRDSNQLSQSLGQIIARAAANACIIQLTSSPPVGSEVSLSVRGKEIFRDTSGQNGWNFSPGSRDRIEVRGSACAEIQKEQKTQIRIWSDCAP